MADASQTMLLRHRILDLFADVCAERERSARARKYRQQSAAVLDNLFIALNQKRGVETLLELGAHEATASRRFIEAGGKRAIAIEANPAVFEKKTRLAAAFGVETINIGLADKAGTMEFFMPPDTPFPGNASFHDRAGATVSQPIDVTTVDALLDSYNVKGTKAAWVDVEGFAFQVLSGANLLLGDPETLALKVEMEDAETWAGQVTALKTSSLVESYGFIPIMVDIEYVGQFNTLYVRPNVLAQEFLAIQESMFDMYKLARALPE